MPTFSDVEQEALTLDEGDRMALARTLLESCEPHPEEEAEQAWEAELRLRLEEVEEETAVGRPSADVFKEIDQKFGWPS